MTLIFLHIPKTGGTTLNSILSKKYPRDRIYSTGSVWRGDPLKEVRAISSTKLRNISLFRGHMPFGIHEFLPKPSTYITMLRDPVERVISHYYFVLAHPSHYDHLELVSNEMTIDQFIQSGISKEMDNGQTRILSGVGSELSFGECDRKLLDKAINHIGEHFAVVGLMEKFDESLLLIKRAMSWGSPPVYIRKNVAKNKQNVGNVSQRTINVIKEYNKLDCELYKFCQQSLNKAAVIHINPNELIFFRILNGIYSLPHKLLYKPARNIGHMMQKFVNIT